MTKRTGIDGRVLVLLVVVNIAAHFIPFARPGFQPDDFFFLHRARIEPEWSFVDASLSQATRPLGFLLFILLPQLLGLSEPSQLLVLVSTTSLLTVLVYLLLSDLLPRPVANLAALAFVLWPVKHEIYASQLFGVNNMAGALIVGSALLYRRWLRTSRPLTLGFSVVCYGLSIFTYEIGYLAPLLFVFMTGSSSRRPPYGVAWFAIPAGLYWAVRLTQGQEPVGGGLYPIALDVFARGLLTSLPSNLVGFQVVRNIAYGLWGVASGPAWFQLWCAGSGVLLGFWALRSIRECRRAPDTFGGWGIRVSAALLSAALLLAPAAMTLVESRHSILAAIGMGTAVAILVLRTNPFVGTAAVLTLLFASQGLALRQAEASRLQAAVRDVIQQRRAEVRSAAVVVFDIKSLADRVSYTWGDRESNMLWGYWGIHAFSSTAFEFMVEDALYEGRTSKVPLVRTCSGDLLQSEATIQCGLEYGTASPFTMARDGTLVIDFKSMTLPWQRSEPHPTGVRTHLSE